MHATNAEIIMNRATTVLSLFLLLLLPTLSASGQTTFTWTGASGTAWEEAANWSPAGVPDDDDTAVIPGGTANLPRLTTNTTIGALDVRDGALLRIVGNGRIGHATLIVEGDVSNQGTIELTNETGNWVGMITVRGVLENGGVVHATGTGTGTRTITGAVENDGELRVDRPMQILNQDAENRNAGTINVADDVALTINGGTLVYESGNLTGPAGRIVLNNVTLQLAAQLQLSDLARLEATNVTVNGPGTLLISEGSIVAPRQTTFNVVVDNAGEIVADREITIAGNAFHNRSSGQLRILGNGNVGHVTATVANGFTNEGTIILSNIAGNWTGNLAVQTGTLVNQGTIIVDGVGTGVSVLAAEVDNSGTIQASRHLRIEKASVVHRNSGEIIASDGSVTIAQTGETAAFIHSGSIIISPPQSLAVSGGTVYFQSNDVRGDGVNLFGQAASLSFTNTTLNLTPDFTSTDINISLNNAVVRGPGVLTTTAGRSLTMSPGIIAADFINHGTVLVLRDSQIESDHFVNEPTGVVSVVGNGQIGNVTLTVSNGFSSHGVIQLTSNAGNWAGHLTVSDGVLINEGTIETVGTGTGTRNLVAALNNRGMIRVLVPLHINRPGVAHRSSGAIDLAGGDLTASLGGEGSFYNEGVVVIGPERTLTLNGGAVTNALLGIVRGQGRMEAASAELTNHGTIAPGMRPMFGENLLTNGDAERGPVAGSNDNVTISGWNDAGAMSILPYDYASAEQEYLTSTDEGPDDRGQRYFWGGNAASSSISRRLDIGHIESLVDLGAVRFELSAYFGGYSVQNDQMMLDVTFLDAEGESVGTARLDPVTAVDRNFETKLMPRNADGAVPVGTRQIDIVLTATRFAGTSNDGYADNLSLILRQEGVEGEGRTAGILTVNSDFPMTSDSARVELAIGGPVEGDDFDWLQINGTASLSGTLDVAFINGFTPEVGDEFHVITFTSGEGQFETVHVSGLPSYLTAMPVYQSDRVVLRVLGEGEFLVAPALTSPEDGTSDVGDQVSLIWETVDGAAGYHVQVSTSRSFTPLVVDTTGVMGTSLDLTNLTQSTTYFWRVRGASDQLPGAFSSTYSFSTETLVSTEDAATLPRVFALRQNYPNPFNPSTQIAYDVAEHAPVTIVVFDVLGRQVAKLIDERMAPGRYEARFDAHGLSSGIYFVRMQAGSFTETRTMVLAR